MLNKIEANEAPLINGDGSQAYDFIYVEDVARSNIQALISEKDYGCTMWALRFKQQSINFVI